ncbi:hypothetical protein [Pleomorphovibrio marinus]|uniref:hypothetical protein n=1 Tax=Pleomorphovibrio marinus TaxID=2164132 RepID=UPI000E0A9E41|nr:hypothetical protein [Pleomorphovibrio marinus]
MKQNLALTISRVFHPMVVMPLFICYVVFSIQPIQQALWTTAYILGIGIFPLAIWNIYRTKTGKYSNFDVSNREQRFSMFGVVFLLAFLLLAYLWLSGQPQVILIGCLLVLGLIFISFLVNFWLKSSLHTAFITYVALGLWPMDNHLSLAIGLGIPIVAWARVTQLRHSLAEVGIGFVSGAIFGILLLYLTGPFSQ